MILDVSLAEFPIGDRFKEGLAEALGIDRAKIRQLFVPGCYEYVTQIELGFDSRKDETAYHLRWSEDEVRVRIYNFASGGGK